ncbi:nicotinamide riboside transporter PnuC [Morganella psychrotolerans]|uniref:Nicotinamide riboside transporter PnuC n=1 Tax=Morganella psychrotolerans TaxID=368603 RepID=A0A5M9R8B3_9GAMM|nr:nicotinamide riboside transporter PnuC [Morganella psychrotolerans]KAA8716432.1 nicotinamide riboside transporter PnuC [Morganella psychrotolerans]
MEFFDINNILMVIPLGKDGAYELSWIEAVGAVAGLLCIWLASLEKTINYLFGLINVTLFAVIFFQIQLYANLLLQIFFFAANVYGWYAWSRRNDNAEAELKIRWMSPLKTGVTALVCLVAILVLARFIDPVFTRLAQGMVSILNMAGAELAMPVLPPDAFPFWDAAMTVLSVAAMILMTRKLVENWLLWVVINIISVVIYYLQGVYALSLEYIILLGVALNGSRMWIKAAKKR